MIIASWNVNSIKARLAHVQQWLASQPVDVLLLQELKGETSTFPAAAMQELGFTHQKIVGEKSYNGVALLSKLPIIDEIHALPGDENDNKARFVGGRINSTLVYCLYAPNGNPIGSEKFQYKLEWLKRLESFMADTLQQETPAVFAGDYNIIPTACDAKTPTAWKDDALSSQKAVPLMRVFLILRVDAYRVMHGEEKAAYTFFDYRAGAWQKNDGIRIDHFLLSPEAADRSTRCWIDTTPRSWDQPSDHTPILLDIAG